jgi:aconitate hydratase
MLELTGFERYDLGDLTPGASEIEVHATSTDGTVKTFSVIVRIDTPKEWDYYQHGGILQYVIRQLLN